MWMCEGKPVSRYEGVCLSEENVDLDMKYKG